MTNLFKLLLVLILGLGAGLAGAATIPPPGGLDAWELFVLGNGDAVFYILNAVKSMMNDSAFTNLLIFVALSSVIVTAVMAGFNPSQHAVKFLMFFITTWLILYVGKELKADVAVQDKISNYYNVVTDVPALVAIPATVISTTGYWMTENIEKHFSLPGELTMTGASGGAAVAGGGFFNLSAKLIADSNSFQITKPELKRSIADYMQNCVPVGLARGDLSLEALKTSTDLWSSLRIDRVSVMTTNFLPAVGSTGTDATSAPGLGTLMSCAESWTRINDAINTNATELMNKGLEGWQNTGTLMPFDTALSSALTWYGGASAMNGASYIKQKSMLNSFKGTFKQAAIQSGNNEMLMGMSIAQAEQSQKSAWVSAAYIFQNMMGYVFVTLQAFIFAMVPIVLIAMLIPGFGLSLTVNFLQIMLWMALWQPLMAIVNFLIQLFGKSTIGTIFASGGGVTLDNSWAISDSANNMVIAAQFLGTMVPLLAWGLVKGAIAFSEFISHGIGSSFSNKAGEMAATGNVGLNSQSMDNQNFNKHNFASQWSTGFQDIQSHLNAGRMAATNNMAGSNATLGGGANAETERIGREVGHTVGTGTSASAGTQKGLQNSAGDQLTAGTQAGTSVQGGQALTSGAQQSLTTAGAQSKAGSNSKGETKNVSEGQSYDASEGRGGKVGIGATGATSPGSSAGGGGGGGGGGMGPGGTTAAAPAGGKAGKKIGSPVSVKPNANAGMSQSVDNKVSQSGSSTKAVSEGNSTTNGASVTTTGSAGTQSSQTSNYSTGANAGTSAGAQKSVGTTATDGGSVSNSTGVDNKWSFSENYATGWSRNKVYDPLGEELGFMAGQALGAQGAAALMSNLNSITSAQTGYTNAFGALSSGAQSQFQSITGNANSALGGYQQGASEIAGASGAIGAANASVNDYAQKVTPMDQAQANFGAGYSAMQDSASSWNPLKPMHAPGAAGQSMGEQSAVPYMAPAIAGSLFDGGSWAYNALRGGGAAAGGAATGGAATGGAAATGGSIAQAVAGSGLAGGTAGGLLFAGVGASTAMGATAFNAVGRGKEWGGNPLGNPQAGVGFVESMRNNSFVNGINSILGKDFTPRRAN